MGSTQSHPTGFWLPLRRAALYGAFRISPAKVTQFALDIPGSTLDIFPDVTRGICPPPFAHRVFVTRWSLPSGSAGREGIGIEATGAFHYRSRCALRRD